MNSFRYRWRSLLLIVLALYFLFAAAVQYNDPDPLHWMALYGLSAVGCFFAAFGRYWLALFWMVLGMGASEMLIALDGFCQWLAQGKDNILASPMSADKPWIEQSREFLGALISVIVAAWLIKSSPNNGARENEK